MTKVLQLYDRKKNDQFKSLTPTQRAQFLEDFRKMSVSEVKEKRHISLRLDNFLLDQFKEKCLKEGLTSYQKQIRLLMLKWLAEK